MAHVRHLARCSKKSLTAQAGKVVGVKINVDDNPGVSQAFQVQSIPMVVAFKDGQAVDGFMGAQGEPMLEDFVSRLLPTEEENEIDSLIAAGDEISLRAALEVQSDHPEGVLALADLLVQDGRIEEGLALLERVPESTESRRIAATARTSDSSGESDEVDAELEDLLSKVKMMTKHASVSSTCSRLWAQKIPEPGNGAANFQQPSSRGKNRRQFAQG